MNNNKYEKLAGKLRELFQLDQPDLDFGFYRVMHAKQAEVAKFLGETLPNIVSSAFQSTNGAKLAQDFAAAKAAVESNLGASAFQDDGTLNPLFAGTPAGKQYLAAKAALDASAENRDGEGDVYDHLYHFFERYYDKGDFSSLRYLTRETDRKAKPYAIPYAGEEVMLHWANADQYYIKTSENFSSYSFNLSEAREIKSMDAMERMANRIPDRAMRVHFRIVAAAEGEHANVKPNEERYFFVDWEHPFEIPDTSDAELTVFFHHEADPDKPDKAKNWQKQLLAKSRDRILDYLDSFTSSLDSTYDDHPVHAYLTMLRMACPTEGNKDRVLLDRYLEQYAARNSADYFIHKDLGGFLRRELDFYIKNEMMILDDVTAATPEIVAKWLGKVKVFREIADKIIVFLAQLEDFQKKLWLKKKFVVQCDWCMTLDLVPEDLREKVLTNPKQKAQWENLGFGDSDSLARMVDTKCFNEDKEFKEKLLASIPDLDERCDGVLVHSENFQALNLLQERYRGQVKCVYIDPPYNTKEGEFAYKDNYKNSSWLSMMEDRLLKMLPLFHVDGRFFVSIDDRENANLILLLKAIFSDESYLGAITWEKRTKSQNTSSAKQMLQSKVEYIHPFSVSGRRQEFNLEVTGEKTYPLFSEEFGNYRLAKMEVSTAGKRAHDTGSMVYEIDGIHPGLGKSWQIGKETVEELKKQNRLVIQDNWPYIIYRPSDESTEKYRPFWSHFFDKEVYGTAESGLALVYSDLGFGQAISTCKPLPLIKKLLFHVIDETSLTLDFFGGSGTTAHAVIDLNRQDRERGIDAKRKYVLVEMGDHFDTVLKPRIEKVVFSPDWKDGKPTAADKGISHCFKYMTLESYEDALNNLVVDNEKGKAFSGLGDYFLKYMLEIETKGSPSLLNVESFTNPFAFRLPVKKPGSEEREARTVDLVETFNYLIGLRVKHVAVIRRYSATFERAPDPELPEDGNTKLTVKELRLVSGDEDIAPPVWEFKMVEGWCPKNRATPDDGAKERVLVVWRTLTGDQEQDNAVLNAYLQHRDVNALDGEYDVIYVNGSNNVPNLRKDEDTWKVRLIEEDFLARMWEGS